MNTNRLFKLGREGVWIVTGHFLAVLGLLVGVRILTELLGPDQYGELALGLTLATFINQFLTAPLSQGAMRFYTLAKKRNDLWGYLKALNQINVLVIGLVGVVFFVCLPFLYIFLNSEILNLVFGSVIFAIANGQNSLLGSIQNAARHRAVVAIHQAISSWGRLGVVLLLFIVLSESSATAMLGYVAGMFITICSQYILFRKTIHPLCLYSANNNTEYWRQSIWKYSWPFGLWGVFTWAQTASDRWFLQLYSSTSDVGYYAVIYQLGYYPITLATSIAVQFLSPILFQKASDDNILQPKNDVGKLTWRLTIMALLLSLIAAMIAFLFHEELFRLLAAAEYRTVSALLPWLVLSGGLFATGQVLALNVMIQFRTKGLIITKVGTAILGISLNYLGARLAGLDGVVVATAITSLAYLLLMLFLFNPKTGSGNRNES